MHKNIFLIILAVLFGLTSNAQDLSTIGKMQSMSLADAKALTNSLANSGSTKFEFYKEKETPEYYSLLYIPAGLTDAQKEEMRVNKFEDGIIFRLTKNENQTYKLREFFADPKLMAAVVSKVFYPGMTLDDFKNNSKYRDFVQQDKGYKFYFYTGEKQYRFYSY